MVINVECSCLLTTLRLFEICVRRSEADLREPVSECGNSVPHHTEELEGNERDVKEEKEELKGWKSGQHRLAAHLLRMGLTFDSGRRRFAIAFGRIGRKHAVYKSFGKYHYLQLVSKYLHKGTDDDPEDVDVDERRVHSVLEGLHLRSHLLRTARHFLLLRLVLSLFPNVSHLGVSHVEPELVFVNGHGRAPGVVGDQNRSLLRKRPVQVARRRVFPNSVLYCDLAVIIASRRNIRQETRFVSGFVRIFRKVC